MGTTAPATLAQWINRIVDTFRRLPPVALGGLVAITYAAIHPLLSHYSRFFWYLPAGARFAALILLPRRYWPWLIAAEWVSRGIAASQYDATLLRGFMATFPQPLAGIVAVWLLQRYNTRLIPDMPVAMARLLGAMLLSAGIEAIAMVVFVLTNQTAPLRMGVPNFMLSVFLGDLSGMLLLAPIALAISRPESLLTPCRLLLTDALLGLGLPLLALYLVQRIVDDPLVSEYTSILTAAPVFYFAFRHGWRGAATATTAAGITLAPLHIPLGMAPDMSISLQFLFVIMGAAALLLGAALDAQRANHAALVIRNADLEQANRTLDYLGVELREAAQRNLRMEEAQRRRFAAEIHDELGQNLTAVHTRLKLASKHLEAAHLEDVTTSIVDILGTMRRSVHGLMDSLRPPALDEFGLVRALRVGPLRDMVERAGLGYALAFRGEPAVVSALREDTQIAIWRIAQEAATNAVRHAHATRFDIHLRIGIRGNSVWAILDLRDDGVGIAVTTAPSRRGEGLQGMRARVLALDGLLQIGTSTSGTRLRLLLRQAV